MLIFNGGDYNNVIGQHYENVLIPLTQKCHVSIALEDHVNPRKAHKT
jgi:hypothetical protein